MVRRERGGGEKIRNGKVLCARVYGVYENEPAKIKWGDGAFSTVLSGREVIPKTNYLFSKLVYVHGVEGS